MDEVHEELKPVVSVLHPPLMKWCMSQTDLDDVDLITDELTGFPVVGEMTQSHYQSIEEPRQKVVMSEDEIISARLKNNLEVLGKVKESEKADEMFRMTEDEVAKGWLEFVRPLEEQDLQHFSLARRLAVVEFRQLEARGWRLRLVDHFTENLCNAGAWSKRKLQSDGLDVRRRRRFTC